MYETTVPALIKGLNNLKHILDKGEQFANSKKIEMTVLLNDRLAPDMLNLIRQVQITCDTAKLGVARLTGKEAPVHEDKEASLADLRTRIDSVVSYLKTLSAKDFAGAEERKITTPRWEGKWLTGSEYLQHHIVPNFYFHITTTYAILRHNGVEIGKKDYLGDMPFKH